MSTIGADSGIIRVFIAAEVDRALRRCMCLASANLKTGKPRKRVSSRVRRLPDAGPPSCKFDHTVDQWASIRSRRGVHRGSGHRLAQREGVYSRSAIHPRLSTAISDCEVPRRLSRLPMTCSVNRSKSAAMLHVTRQRSRRSMVGTARCAVRVPLCNVEWPFADAAPRRPYQFFLITLKICTHSSRHPRTKNNACGFKILGMTPF